MLNWKRINNVINCINNYIYYELIDEIIIFNNNSDLDLKKLSNDKIVIIESSKDLGLYSRFSAAGLAKNACILHCDDDIFLPEATVNGLYKSWLNNQTVCHGLEGRVIKNEYNTVNVLGDVHIVLTRCLMVSKRNCLLAFALSVYFDDLISCPKGNGEDIILSYTSMYYSKAYNRTYKLPYSNYPDYKDKPDGTSDSIHRTFGDHLKHRTAVILRCNCLLGGR